jgi:glycosyltransferase involved in cell wall biosynthesis
MIEPRVLVISPVRNEAPHIERVIRAMAAQTRPPDRWIVVDDGSDDGTWEWLQALQPHVPFLDVMRRCAPDDDDVDVVVRDRLARAAAPRAFNEGLARADRRAYTHIMKLDGDIELPPHYFHVLLDAFAQDPSLGLCGADLEEEIGGEPRLLRIPPTHVHGALKCWTRDCFEAIGGVQERLGWDTIDETYARMRGYATYHLPYLVARHLRPVGSADGTLRGRARHGECAYIAHFEWWWVTLRAGKLARSRPRGLSGAAFLFGYASAAGRRVERVPDPEFRRFARQELRDRAWHAVRTSRQTLSTTQRSA